ncbi:MAG TPA: lipid-binding SYLF domain-containing protein [Defluviitoga sp.]|nr:lipid-binding SYLF domain-containing protein [Defluviitoga sp.]HOP24500.1 lipid-binding SYLF domain-containing protein [Defluviitoga sp.]HPZ29029.1 lipid-binding SYLF domain-containing protein [Defluviitoga sp.]HQD62958.1 lipid-binding SYLF domain-containing protein [Defluviitoga sp.]
MKKILPVFIFVLLVAFSTFAAVADIITESRLAIEELLSKQDSGAFVQLVEQGQGVVIFPTFYKLGFVIGGQYGEGIVLRKDSQTGEWYGPAFVNIYGLSVGAQAGVQSASLVLVVMNEQGMNGFMGNNFTLGGSLGVAAGPVGRQLSADVDYRLKASIYSYSVAKGFYAGASIEGAYIRTNDYANEAFYKEQITPEQILKEKKVEGEAKKIVELLEDAVANLPKENQ